MSDIEVEIDEALRQRLEARRPSPIDAQTGGSPRRSRRAKVNTGQRWMRWLHVYMSMIAFVVILFFGITGLLLNHPQWLDGDQVTTTTLNGTLPNEVIVEGDRVEFLAVSEYLRSEHGVHGEVTNFDQVGAEGSINYTAPGYGASARFDVNSLEYDVTVRSEGFVNAMRDLHTGSDSGSAWSLIIDIAAVFLVAVSITGLGIQLLMRKRRRSALLWMAGGTTIVVILMWIALS